MERDVLRGKGDSSTRRCLKRRELLSAAGGGAVLSYLAACSPGSTPSRSSEAADGPLHYASLSRVARLIEAGKLSPVALTRQLLDRITALDAGLHSYVTVMADHAMASARRAEAEIRAGDPSTVCPSG